MRFSAARPRWTRSIGQARPSLSMTGASPISVPKRTPSSVADIAIRRRSGRSAACASSASARPKSLSRLRSCTSSNRTAETPASSGSVWTRFRKMPSVSTVIRVRAERLRVEPCRIADRAADRLARQLRHPLRRRARGEPAGREQKDLAGAPGLAEQGRRHRRRLARSRRRDEHRVAARAEGGGERIEHCMDGQSRHPALLGSLCRAVTSDTGLGSRPCCRPPMASVYLSGNRARGGQVDV